MVERKNRHLLEVTCALLIEMTVKSNQTDVVLTDSILLNSVPTKTLNGKEIIQLQPNESMFAVPPKSLWMCSFVYFPNSLEK